MAQINFKQVLPPAPAPQIIPVFSEVDQGSIAYADVDGINGLDVLVTGSNNADEPIAKLYINDGSGNYSEKIGTPFVGVTQGSVAFADIDLNGTQDVLITGFDGTNRIAKLYTNDGNANFIDEGSIAIFGVAQSAITFADFDGQNGPDVLVTGISAGGNQTKSLYINDGDGNFSNVNAANIAVLAAVNRGAVDAADIDGDGDVDLVITGDENLSNAPVTEIYLNDGNADFTKLTGTTFVGVEDSDVAFADLNGDNTHDLLISGFNSSGNPITKLYTNEIVSGNATFTEMSTTIDALGFSSFAIADVDGQNGSDVLLTGSSTGGSSPVSKLYINDGAGNFTLESGTAFTNVFRGAVALLDLDGDNDQDLVISGRKSDGNPITEIFGNDGAGAFTLATGTPFIGVRLSAADFADIDGNGSQDVLITGRNKDNVSVAKLYTNDGNGSFVEVTGTPFTGVGDSDVAFADVDGINGPDVIITGVTNPFPFNYLTKFYTNNGSGVFTEETGAPFTGLGFGSISFADVDGVNGLDVVITGQNNAASPVTELYTRDGLGDYSAAGTFTDITKSSTAFADMDGENGPDLIISGENSTGTETTELYINNGSGGFSLDTGTPFEPVKNSAIAVGDVVGNSGLDVLITGTDGSGDPVTKLYANNGTVGNPTFTEVGGTPFEVVDNGSVAIADIDGVDGNDIIISGENSSGEYITKLYINDGSGNFTEVTNLPFDGAFQGNISLADVDSDGLIDVLITGRNNAGINISKLYRNVTDFIEPNITSAPTASVEENVTSSFYTATADKQVTFTLGTSKDEEFFKINGGQLSFLNAADFENPQDANTDNVYLIDLIATDQANNVVTEPVAITVTNVDDVDPTITSGATASVPENTTGTIYTATADEAVTYSFGSSKDEALFTLSTDAISFTSAPDFETPLDANADNEYLIDLIATDNNGNSSTKEVAVTVTDVVEAGPVITSPATATVAENVTGTVYTATADIAATFSLGDSKDEARFSISNGAISFDSAPDFEAPLDTNGDNIYLLDLIATDGDDNSTTKAISITVTDVDEGGPVITSPATATVEENVTGTVYTATADVTATFSLGDSKDEAQFSITNGAISFDSAPDFETPLDANGDNIYLLDLIATDGDENSTTKAISITVTDVDEAGPVITSPATATVEENVTGTVYTATADVTATFSLGDSKDEAQFSISNGVISFDSAPDFETPLDANGDNIYLLDLIATDGDENSTTKAISITVTDVDESGPTITSSASVSVEENVTGTVYTATTDVAASFSLDSNKDGALFNISSDAISFKTAPDFEAPADANADNVYQVDLIATNGEGFSTTKAISITVTNVEEEPLSNSDEILGKIYPNPVQNTLFIQPVNMSKDALIRITDIAGRLQKTINYGGYEQEVDVSDLEAGVYMLKISSNGKQMLLKFIKE
ncbi:Por secretion system C-terminal sorting domain-containing protein [Marivirga sericea]|uniref:Por secretion system C-terminal sorting domain-containing protein n=2 Tax=Marivirga sericea TaxID=1028 RepID=A0A1X7KHN9_9BACT|nr:Por secretion system C-terminal sorting domain-containing protein [Marivirga sericea]